MMERLVAYTEQAPQSVKIVSDIGVWGVVAAGWLELIQPWLTGAATILAIAWTGMQMYAWFKRKK